MTARACRRPTDGASAAGQAWARARCRRRLAFSLPLRRLTRARLRAVRSGDLAIENRLSGREQTGASRSERVPRARCPTFCPHPEAAANSAHRGVADAAKIVDSGSVSRAATGRAGASDRIRTDDIQNHNLAL